MGKMWKEMIVVCFKVQCRKKIQRELRETKVAKSSVRTSGLRAESVDQMWTKSVWPIIGYV